MKEKGEGILKRNTLGSLIWLRIARFTHQSNVLTNECLKEFNLTSAQFDVLVQVLTYEPISQTDLAQKVTISQGGISRMLDRLEKENYIVREQDWKTKMICLSDKGKNKVDKVFDQQLDFQSSFFEDVLTKEEQQTLLTLMTKVQKNSENKLKEHRGDKP